jgi:GT2 family glycosyltransferase
MSAGVDVVIPTWNRVELLARCLAALAIQDEPPRRVTVVDNGSADGTAAMVRREFPHVQLIELDTNVGFAAAVNLGIEAGDAPFVALLNNDAIAERAWLRAALDAFGDGIGAVASSMVSAADPTLFDSAGVQFRWAAGPRDLDRGRPVDGVTSVREVFGACAGAAVYRREALDAVGMFPAEFFAYFEDVDVAWRLRAAGWGAVHAPASRVSHIGGATIGHFSSRHVRLCARNEWLVVLRNVPGGSLVRHAPQLAVHLARSCYSYGILHRRPVAWLAGIGDVVKALPRIRGERCRIRASARVGAAELERAINTPRKPSQSRTRL